MERQPEQPLLIAGCQAVDPDERRGERAVAGNAGGALAAYSARAGIECWGIDASGAMLAVLQAKLARYGLAAELRRADMRDFSLERTFGLTGGNIFQGSMLLNQLFMFRPVVGFADYRTPIKNLFLCGSAAHPGGGVMGAPGWNAARTILGK